LLKANPELAALHATLVKKGKGATLGKTTGEGGAADDDGTEDDGIRGAVTEEQFWAEREHLFDAAVAKKGAAQVAGVSNALDGDVKGTRDGRTDTVSCALSNEKMHRIFAERPAVRRAFLDNVPSKMTEVRPIHWSPYDGVGVVNAVP
jgi:transcription initiation factor TFIIH subunit 1